MGLCVFDLDHTLIRTPLDLAAMAVEIRALIERARGPLPARPERYRVGELIAWAKSRAPELEPAVWEVARAHEQRAMDMATLEPGALEAVAGARRVGFITALWTNNGRSTTVPALERLELAPLLDLVVTRDDMRALKPDPDGWRVISERFTARFGGGTAAAGTAAPLAVAHEAVVVGDSWVDGLAAAAAGVPFVAYSASEPELARWGVTPVARLADLARLPDWLAARANGIRR